MDPGQTQEFFPKKTRCQLLEEEAKSRGQFFDSGSCREEPGEAAPGESIDGE